MAILNLDSLRAIKPSTVHAPKRATNQEGQKQKTQDVVLEVIKNNELLNVQDIVKLTELAASTVYRVVTNLEKNGLISISFGGGKSGYGNTFYSAI